MRVDPAALSALPYKPQLFQDKDLSGLGHPDLVPRLRQLKSKSGNICCPETLVLKEHPNLIFRTRLLPEQDFPWPGQVIKQFKWRGIQNFLLSPFKKSKAVKSYLAACHLLKHGLSTPMPLGAVEFRILGFIRRNIYITEVINDYIDLRKYRDTLPHGPEDMREVLHLLAGYILRMHDSGLWHRDLNLRNFLLTGRPGKHGLYLVDLNRARILKNLPVWVRALDMSRLDLKGWQMEFFEIYCNGRFHAPAMLKIANLARARRSAWRRVAVPTSSLRKKFGLK